MKKNILIWGTGYYVQEVLANIDMQKCNILAYIESNKSKEIFNNKAVITPNEIDELSYDYILIANSFYNEIKSIIDRLNISSDKVINWLDRYINEKQQQVLLSLIKSDSPERKLFDFYKVKPYMPYQSCLVEDIKYIYNSMDEWIPDYMHKTGENWSSDDIRIFFELAQEYYGNDLKEEGVFFDIGGNIGTTSIYVKKHINPKLVPIAFEPIKENYKIFKVNCILNDFSDTDIIVENIGISNKNSNEKMYINTSNFGNSQIISSDSLEVDEEIKCVKLEDYIIEKQIDSNDIKYIWMDIEGHEAYAIQGARKILKDTKIPLFMEFTPIMLKENNSYELLLNELMDIYSAFICISKYKQGIKKPQPIKELITLADELDNQQCDLFLIK